MATFTANSNGIYAKLVVTEQSQSVANNTTTLLWEIYMWNTTAKPNWYMYDQHNIFQVKINGEYVLNNSDFGRVSLQYEQPESAAKLITSGTYTIAHNSDGTKTGVPVYLYAAQGWEYAYVWETSGTMNLTTIARASQPSLSASSITLGSAVTIYTNRASSSFTHTLEYSIGSASGTIASGVGDKYDDWPPSKELARQFPNATSGVVTITCKTYNGSTLIGTKQTFLTINISSDMIPSVSATISEAATIPSGISGYIKTRSKLKIVVSASGSYGSTIMSYKITANGATYNASEATTGYLTTAGSNTITVTVTDSRGQTKTYSTTVTVLDYSPPRIDSLNAYRCNSSGTADAEGAYMKVAATGTITSLSSTNGRSVTLQTRPSGGSWVTQSVTLGSGYSGFAITSAVISADTATSYEVRVQVADSFGSSSYYTTTVSTASILMNIHIGENDVKDGMAIGKMAEKAKTVQLGWDLELKGDPTEDNHAANKKYVDGFKYGNRHVITVDGDANTYYPVLVGSLFSCQGSFAWSHLHISRHYAVTAPDSWYTSTHKGGLSLSLRWSGDTGWGGNDHRVVVEEFSEIYTSMVGGLDLSVNGLIVWLRGGTAEYTFQTDYGSDMPITVYLSTFTASDGNTYAAKSTPDTSGVYDRWYDRHGSYNGNISRNTTGEVTSIHNTGYGYSYAYFKTSDNVKKGSVGYWEGMTYIGEEAGSCARIGVTSGGVPQYWSSYDPSTAKNLLHTGIVSDYPVAQATSGHGIWSFIKFNSGIAMCWGQTAICDTAFTATWGNWYIHDYLFPAQRFPFDFVEIPKVFASQGKHGTTACEWSWYSGGEATTQYTPRYSVFRPTTTEATVNLSLNLFAIGRWK